MSQLDLFDGNCCNEPECCGGYCHQPRLCRACGLPVTEDNVLRTDPNLHAECPVSI